MAARERVIGASVALADGGAGIRFTVNRDGRDLAGFAIRYDGRVYAYANACAHRAAELDWLPGAFFDAEGTHLVCSLHGALYEPHTGRCVAGPCAGAALERLAVVERAAEGIIVVIDDNGDDANDDDDNDIGCDAPVTPPVERNDHG